jgi:hypothetical protein
MFLLFLAAVFADLAGQPCPQGQKIQRRDTFHAQNMLQSMRRLSVLDCNKRNKFALMTNGYRKYR